MIHGKWKTTTKIEKIPRIVNPPHELKKKPRKYDIHDHLRIFYLSLMYRDYILGSKQIHPKLNIDLNFLELFRLPVCSKKTD